MIKKPSIKIKNAWVAEAKDAAKDWRQDSWRSCEALDGKILTDEEYDGMIDAGITPLDINRIFPVVNLVTGSQAINKYDSIAKGRTNDDTDLAKTMTEGVKFVYDQNDVEFKVAQAFKDGVVPGIGYLSPGINHDPRKEKIQIKYQDWKTVWTDPFADPWLDTEKCRYVFNNPWKNLDDICAQFPDKEKDIKDQYDNFTGQDKSADMYQDEADTVEDYLSGNLHATDWADKSTRRIRPVEMWYTVFEDCLFSIFPDGRAVEITEDMEPQQQYQLITNSQETIKVRVKKMRRSIFLGELELVDRATHLPHDEFPLVPFVGYTDRFNAPYGIPRQIIGQNVEVIKRRSVALEMLKKRRLLIEENALADESPNAVDDAFDEINKLDGLLLLKDGALTSGKVRIEEQQALVQGQMVMHDASEKDIQQVSGANEANLGYGSRAQSGKAMEIEKSQGNTILASLFNNLRRSQKRMGEQTLSLIQGEWTAPKILRVTDDLLATERFIQLNEKVQTENGAIEIRNDVTQGKYDFIVTEAPATDTIREKNMNLLIEWVKKSPPEFVPHLLNMAMEMSNMPNKEVLLAKLKPLMGDTMDEDMTPDQIKEQQAKSQEAAAEEQQVVKDFEQAKAKLELEGLQLDNEIKKAEVKKIQSETIIKKETSDIDNLDKGFETGKKIAEATA